MNWGQHPNERMPEHALFYLEPMPGVDGFQEWGKKLWYFSHNARLITHMVRAFSLYTDAMRERNPNPGPYEQFDGVKRLRGAFLEANQPIDTIADTWPGWYYFDAGIHMWADSLLSEAVCLDPRMWPDMAVLDPHYPKFYLEKKRPIVSLSSDT